MFPWRQGPGWGEGHSCGSRECLVCLSFPLGKSWGEDSPLRTQRQRRRMWLQASSWTVGFLTLRQSVWRWPRWPHIPVVTTTSGCRFLFIAHCLGAWQCPRHLPQTSSLNLLLWTKETLFSKATQPACGWDLNPDKTQSLPTILGSFPKIQFSSPPHPYTPYIRQ